MTMTIRAAHAGDEALLADLNRFVQEVHLVRRPDVFKPTRAAELATWFGTLLQDAAAGAWIAEDDGQAAGYVLAIHHERPENPFCHARRWCEIDQLAVDPRWRRRGVATALVREAIADARRRGVRDVELNAWSFNEDAQRVFRRMGFVPRAIRFEDQDGSGSG